MRSIRTARALAAATAIALAALTTAPASAQSLSTYTYQGVLDNTGAPAQGVHEFRFRIFDAPAAGTLLCFDTRTKNFSADDQGRFTFDDLACTAPFEPGQDRWIEVSVRQGTSGPFTVLGPRRIVNATPFAVYAENAATSLDDAYDNGNVINADTDPVEILGTLNIGNDANNGTVDLFGDVSSVPLLSIEPDTDGEGAQIRWFDETGTIDGTIEPDSAGQGLFVRFSGGGPSALVWDGSAISGNTGRFSIFGGNSTMFFDTNNLGDAALTLPNDAVAANEILDEPGLASFDQDFLGTLLEDNAPTATIASRSINAPADGFIFASATVELFVDHATGGVVSTTTLGLSTLPTTFQRGLEYANDVPAGVASNTSVWQTVTITGTFPANAGANTIYLVGDFSGGTGSSVQISDIELTTIFFPTAYGPAGLSELNPLNDGTPDDVLATQIAPRGPMTPAEIAAEQADAAAFNQQRILDELNTLRQRVAELEANASNNRPANDSD